MGDVKLADGYAEEPEFAVQEQLSVAWFRNNLREMKPLAKLSCPKQAQR
jgi:hypothetical protein